MPTHRRKNRAGGPIVPDRVRCAGSSGFAFVPNRFVHDGFFSALSLDELGLYLLLVLVGDRRGLNFYHYDSLCELLRWPLERYIAARNSLVEKDLIAYDGTQFQVLELPALPPRPKALRTAEELEQHDAATIRNMIEESLGYRP